MADKQLIIDDDYCTSMGTYFEKQGEQLDAIISKYIVILKKIKQTAILSGEVSSALGEYIKFSEKLQGQIGAVSDLTKNHILKYLEKIDYEDKYLFWFVGVVYNVWNKD